MQSSTSQRVAAKTIDRIIDAIVCKTIVPIVVSKLFPTPEGVGKTAFSEKKRAPTEEVQRKTQRRLKAEAEFSFIAAPQQFPVLKLFCGTRALRYNSISVVPSRFVPHLLDAFEARGHPREGDGRASGACRTA